MSDETSAAPFQTPSAMHEHYCEYPDCKAWGGFGYDIGKGETKWFCFEHRWLDYRQPRYGDRPTV
ncbi:MULTISPECIES: hypothetical protein [unclassified Rhizobium]|uniref:hypothetical protein n=1 Tax=unclassified Rhizobium TaxID=2613769 RepID=UPI00161A566C|nr:MULTISPECIES: hypothetical protein [unclassified Rhizobium]MBB3288145.1 hypothetical protein [Rhizobium sp. BK252]MBB3402991.1 hypothetical protein [Rhizobium sp. BK289]MBB3415568.1 hypothetical protein [Rhizobium sp. BK284]MBB3483351.1 hypothetical protein [Rhizobium sp. BK347]